MTRDELLAFENHARANYSRRKLMTNGEQCLLIGFQGLRQKNQFHILNTSKLSFDFRNCIFADVPADTRTTSSEHCLRPTLSVTDFSHDRADQILRNDFAHNFALTVMERGLRFLPISEGTVLPLENR